MFERFSDRARRVVVAAAEEGRRLDHDYIGTEHLLLGLVGVTDGAAGRALAAAGVELDAARAAVEELVGRGDGSPPGHIPFTPRAKKVLELALREALALDDTFIGTEHILLGLLRDGEGDGCRALAALGVAPAAVEASVRSLIGAGAPAGPGRGGWVAGARRRFRLSRRVVVEPPGPFDELPVLRRLTDAARGVLLQAESESVRQGRAGVGEQDLLVSIVAEGEGGGARALAALGVTPEAARALTEPPHGQDRPGHAALLPAALDVLELALVEAVNRGRQEIDTEDILLGLVHRADDGAGEAPALFAALGTTADAVRAAVAGLSEG